MFSALGYNGRGMAMGTLMGRVLAELIKPPLEVETSDMWPWVLSPPQEAGQTGVLYRVEALELRRQACSGKPS